MKKFFLISMTQLGIVLIGTGWVTIFPEYKWSIGVLTGFLIGNAPIFMTYIIEGEA